MSPEAQRLAFGRVCPVEHRSGESYLQNGTSRRANSGGALSHLWTPGVSSARHRPGTGWSGVWWSGTCRAMLADLKPEDKR